LKIDFSKGILRWKYGKEPTIFLARSQCYCDQLEIESGSTNYDLIKRQYYLMKKVLTDVKETTGKNNQKPKGT
jgi:hypothetical protein